MTVLTVTADQYHADQVHDGPTLNASIVKLLVAKTPRHAREAHPRLNPSFERKAEEKYELGQAAHSLLLEGVDAIEVIHADSWKTAAAREARDLARAHGRVPLLPDQAAEVRAMVAAIWDQLAEHEADPPLFRDGKPEQAIVWQEDGVWCRARLDWLRDDHTAVDDLKTTRASAEPRAWAKTLFNMGGHIQAAYYLRGLRAVLGAEPAFRFCAAECAPPYSISVVDLAPSARQLADAQIDYALRVWRRCLESGDWPGYPVKVASIEAPTYEETRWLEREATEEMAA